MSKVYTKDEPMVCHSDMWDDTLLIQQYDSAMSRVKQSVAAKPCNTNTQSHTDDNIVDNTKHKVKADEQNAKATSHSIQKRKRTKKGKGEWKVGDTCRCVYDEDGETYEGTITAVFPALATADVLFCGYGNTETVKLHALTKSHGTEERRLQERQAEEEIMNGEIVDEAGSEGSAPSVVGSRTGGPGPWESVGDESGGEEEGEEAPHSHHRHNTSHHNGRRSHTTSTTTTPRHRHNHSVMDGMPHLPDLPPPPALSLPGDSASNEMLHTMLMSWYMTGYHTGYYKGVCSASRPGAAAAFSARPHRHHSRGRHPPHRQHRD